MVLNLVSSSSPALSPEDPANRSPRFLIMKLEPIKREELIASMRPIDWSLHAPDVSGISTIWGDGGLSGVKVVSKDSI